MDFGISLEMFDAWADNKYVTGLKMLRLIYSSTKDRFRWNILGGNERKLHRTQDL